jgi:polyhydroxybutyrate depolymerase
MPKNQVEVGMDSPRARCTRSAGTLSWLFGAGLALGGTALVPHAVEAQVAAQCAPSRPFASYPWGTTQTLAGIDRNYTVRVPANYDGKKPLPVVVIFHGFGMNSALEASFDLLGGKATGKGFIVVYANGASVNGGPRGWNYFGNPSRPNDVAYAEALFSDLESRFCVDSSREFLVGHSAGAAFASYYACKSSREFAGVATVSASQPPTTCADERTIPTLHFQGVNDQRVPYDGGVVSGTQTATYAGDPVPPVEQTVAAWAEHNGCAANQSRTQVQYNLTRIAYTDCPAGLEDVLYRIEGAGHGWPGSLLSVAAYMGVDTYSVPNVPASDMIVSFFQRHSQL